MLFELKSEIKVEAVPVTPYCVTLTPQFGNDEFQKYVEEHIVKIPSGAFVGVQIGGAFRMFQKAEKRRVTVEIDDVKYAEDYEATFPLLDLVRKEQIQLRFAFEEYAVAVAKLVPEKIAQELEPIIKEYERLIASPYYKPPVVQAQAE